MEAKVKVLASLLLMIAITAPRLAAPPKFFDAQPKTQAGRKGGRWYFAETGHAVYCLGPVMVVNEPGVGFQRVATFCQGDKAMVPLKD